MIERESETVNVEKGFKPQNNSMYFMGLVLGLVALLLKETMLRPELVMDFCQLISSFLLIMHLVSVMQKYTPRMKVLMILALFMSLIIGICSDAMFQMFFMFALIFGAKGISYYNILKIYNIASAVFCISILLLCYLGLVSNVTAYSDGRELISNGVVRNSFGYVWPTDLATHIFFILLTYWILIKGKLSIVKVCLYLFISYWVLIKTDARLGTGCVLLILLFTVYLRFQHVIPLWLHALFARLTIVWIPILFILTMWATLNYDSGNMDWFAVDVVLSGRLRIGQDSFMQEGITFWGQKVEMKGGETIGGMYNYIDSSFLQAIIIYGVCFTFLLLVAYLQISYKAYKRKDYTFICAIFIAGISGFIAQHFLQIFMNPLLISLFAENDVVEQSNVVGSGEIISNNIGC